VDAEDFSAYHHCVAWGAEFLDSYLQPTLDKYEEDSDDEDVETAIDGAATDTTNIDEDDVGGLDDVPAEKLLINLYLLADMLIDPITANLVIDKLISVMAIRNEYFCPALVRLVYESTTDDSLLRKLVLDYHITSDLDSDLSKHLKGKRFPSDFISDVLFGVFALKKSQPLEDHSQRILLEGPPIARLSSIRREGHIRHHRNCGGFQARSKVIHHRKTVEIPGALRNLFVEKVARSVTGSCDARNSLGRQTR
jgi:hypothetical protein